MSVEFEYTGDSCDASDNDQGDKAECDGDPEYAEPVDVEYTGKDTDKISLDDSSLSIGDTMLLEATGRDHLHAATTLEISDSDDIIQDLELHTSCSKPLAVGDQFGSLVITDIIFEDEDGECELDDIN